ncbi:MAG: fibronectin type III domain-containing protein, partial [Patescibacteria group bacterium]
MTRRLRLFLSAATVVSLTVGVFLFISGPVKAAPYFSPPTISATVVSSTSVSVNVSNIHENTDYMYLYKDGSYWGSIWSSATVGSLTCGEHSFRVLAEDIYGSTANSNTVYATASACPAFYAPSLSGGAGGQTSINLSWNDPNTNEQGYRVYNPPYNTPIATLGANSTSYSVSGLLCGTSYSYYVQAYNTTTGQTATSNTVSPSTSACPDNSPPNAAPSSLRKTSSTTTTISLAWNDNSNNEDGFFLYRGGVKIADLGPNTTSATASGLTCNSSYSFSVTGYKRYTTVAYQENIWRKALSWLGFGYVAQAADQYIYVESSASSVTTTTSSCDTVAPSVSSLNPSAGTSYSSEGYTVSVSYTDNTGVATIQYCTSPAGQCSPSSTAATNSVSVTVSSATTYFCHRATDVVGNQSATSCATYYLRPTSPIDINATYNYSAGTVTISWWDTSTKETRFDITRSGAQSGSFTASAVSGTGFTSYTDTTKPIAGTYTYAVAACNAA